MHLLGELNLKGTAVLDVMFELVLEPGTPLPSMSSEPSEDWEEYNKGFLLPFYNGYVIDIAALLSVYALMCVLRLVTPSERIFIFTFRPVPIS